MTYKQVKQTLNHLHAYLEQQYLSAQKDMDDEHYKEASDSLASAIGKGERDVELAQKEENLPSSGLEQDTISKDELDKAYQDVASKLSDIVARKALCDRLYSIKKFAEENVVAQERKKDVLEKIETAKQYERSFAQLNALKRQPEPFVGVKEELIVFLKQVKEMKAQNSVPTFELTQAMNATYDRLTGGSKEKFDAFVKKMHSKDSIFYKILGAALIALGAALIASAILFAPVVIAPVSYGIVATYFAVAGVTAASSALTIGGTSCFFKNTDQMKLSDTAKKLGEQDLETQQYAPIAV